MVSYRSARLADFARKPGSGSLRLTASAIAVAAAIASSPVMADGKNKEGKDKSTHFGPVVPNISTGVGNFNKPANVVVASLPAATSTMVGNNLTPPSSGTANVTILPSAAAGAAPGNTPAMSTASGAGLGSSKVETGDSGREDHEEHARPATRRRNRHGLADAGMKTS